MTEAILTAYDAVTPANIPRSARVVFGYDDGIYEWTAASWDLFPDAIKKTIAVRASDDGDVLDIERGDADPDQGPAWAQRQRGRGVDPWCYMNASTWPAVVAAFSASSVAPPLWWVAQYNGDQSIPGGAAARQYQDYNDLYDISNVYASALGLDPAPPRLPGSEMETDFASVTTGPLKGTDLLAEINPALQVWVKNRQGATPWSQAKNQCVPGQAIPGTLRVVATADGGQVLVIFQEPPDGKLTLYATDSLAPDGTVRLGHNDVP